MPAGRLRSDRAAAGVDDESMIEGQRRGERGRRPKVTRYFGCWT